MNNGERTWALADDDKNRQEANFARRYLSANPNAYTLTSDKKSRVYHVDGGDPYAQHGNFSIVTDADGSNARIYDDWDYGKSFNVKGHKIELSSKNLPGMVDTNVGIKLDDYK